MNCNNINDRLIDFIEGQLEEEEKLAVKRHIDSCEDCLQDLESLRPLLEDVGSFGKSYNEEENILWANYLPQVRERINRKKERKLWIRAAVPAIGILSIAILLFFLNGGGKPDSRMGEEWTPVTGAEEWYIGELVDFVVDSSDVEKIIISRLISPGMIEDIAALEESEGFGYDNTDVDVSSQEYGYVVYEAQELGTAALDYIIERSDLDTLLEDLDQESQEELLQRLEAISLSMG